jgi:hypothetical protein
VTVSGTQSRSRTQEAIRRSSGGHQEVIRRSSRGNQEVIRRHSGGHQEAIRRSSGGHQEALERSSACNQRQHVRLAREEHREATAVERLKNDLIQELTGQLAGEVHAQLLRLERRLERLGLRV